MSIFLRNFLVRREGHVKLPGAISLACNHGPFYLSSPHPLSVHRVHVHQASFEHLPGIFA